MEVIKYLGTIRFEVSHRPQSGKFAYRFVFVSLNFRKSSELEMRIE